MILCLLILLVTSVLVARAQLPGIDICVSRLASGSELIDVHVPPSSTDGSFYVLRKNGVLARFFRTNATLRTVLDISARVRNNG
jgi:hypothetical protein